MTSINKRSPGCCCGPPCAGVITVYVLCDKFQGVGTFSGSTFAGSRVTWSVSATITNNTTSHVDTVTGAGGGAVTGLPAGSYTVAITSSAPSGWRTITPSSQTITLGCNQHLTLIYWSVQDTYDVGVLLQACNCYDDPSGTTFDFTIDDGHGRTASGTATYYGPHDFDDRFVGYVTLTTPDPGEVPIAYTVTISSSNRPWYDLPISFTSDAVNYPGCGAWNQFALSDTGVVLITRELFGTVIDLNSDYTCVYPANTGTPVLQIGPKKKILHLSDGEGSCVLTHHYSNEGGIGVGCLSGSYPAGGKDIWTGSYTFTTDGATLAACPYTLKVGYHDHVSVTVTNWYVAWVYLDGLDPKWHITKAGMWRPCCRSCDNFDYTIDDFHTPCAAVDPLRTDSGGCFYAYADGISVECDPTAISWTDFVPGLTGVCAYSLSFLAGGTVTE